VATGLFGSFAVRASFTEGYCYSNGTLPDVVAANDGAKPLLVTQLAGAVSGRGASRTLSMYLGSSSAGLTRASSGSAQDTGTTDTSDWLTSALTVVQYGYSGLSGSCYFGRSADGSGFTQGAFGTWSGSIGMYYDYAFSPTAPTLGSVTPSLDGTQAVVNFSAPSSTGDAPILGYNLQGSTSATFASGVTTTAVAATGATISGLTPGVGYYWRITARNTVSDLASKLGGAWSGTVFASQPDPSGFGLIRYSGAWEDAAGLIRYSGAWEEALMLIRHSGAWVEAGP